MRLAITSACALLCAAICMAAACSSPDRMLKTAEGVDDAGTGANAGAGYQAGNVDELRVSNVIRYTELFQPVRRHEPDAATLGFGHVDEGEGGVIADSSGKGTVGEIVGSGVRWRADDGYGKSCEGSNRSPR